MPTPSTAPYRFGDLLALARQSWVRQMAESLATAGYHDYRRSDAAALRRLAVGPMSIGRLGDALGVTRQAARKVVAGLERRGYASTERDDRDARQLNVVLTALGQDYARSITAVIDRLNRTVARTLPPDQLAAADAALRAVLADEHARTLASFVAPPPARER